MYASPCLEPEEQREKRGQTTCESTSRLGSWISGLLEQLQRDGPFGLGLHTLAPELEFGVDGAVEDKVPRQALGVEGTDWRVVGNLLRHQPETLILSARDDGDRGGQARVHVCVCGIVRVRVWDCACVCERERT